MPRWIRHAVAGIEIALVIVAAPGIGLAAPDDDVQLTGSTYDKAVEAALEHVGEGEVTDTEEGDEGAAYTVEVLREDGKQVEVQLNERFEVTGSEPDDDRPGGVDDPDVDDSDAGDDSAGRIGPSRAVASLSPTIDNRFVAFESVRRAVYEGQEVDEDTGEPVQLRIESVPLSETDKVDGAEVAIVDVAAFEDGELVEQTFDLYSQHADGRVFYMGELVDFLENGEVVSHEGEWLAGEGGARPGLFMPADPQVGDEFAQERVPGLAEDRSKVVATDVPVSVPAGDFKGCIETEDVNPIDDETEHKFYCPDVGLVREVYEGGGALELTEIDLR